MLYEEFMEAGYRIFGLHPIKDGECSCSVDNCKATGKHPVAGNWQHTPEWSDDQLEVMEMTGQLETGYGVLVSRGLLVIDVDARNGGVPSYEKLYDKIPTIAGAGLVVQTGSGGGSKHLYFKCPEGLALLQHHDDYPGIDFKSSGFVVGPGSLHASGNEYEILTGSPEEIGDPPQELLDLLAKPERHRAEINGELVDVSHEEIAEMLSYIDPDTDHETWYRCGMAVHHATGGTGFDIWDAWSNNGEKYPGRSAIERRWHSFGKSANPVTLGTLVKFAEDGGWESSVTFSTDIEFDYEEPEPKDGLPFSIEGVDLLRPPGMVGEVCQWINDQCRYPRESLAVAASLVAMGNVCGLRYTDDKDGVSANMFAFSVAGSATGKEAVQQAVAEIHRAAGIHGATHGAIKSEQEIVRNLIRNQASYYIIDEIGIFLQKVANAQKRGGAVYLDGVIGMLMAAYSKADGFMLLTGDTKDEVRRALVQELAQCRKQVSENEDKTGSMQRRIPQLEKALEHIDNGLERPFLSMIGFTTPITFDGLVTHEQATNGFIGRSLLINERETNPRARRGFKKRPMPEKMKFAISRLYTGGDYDPQNARVEYYGEKSKVKTTDQAIDMMESALDWLEDEAEKHKERTGLEAVVRRGYELMAKISLVLSAPEGVRTAEHVRWSFAMMKRDIDEKTRLAYANEREKEDPQGAIVARVLNLIDHENGGTLAYLNNRIRQHPKKDIEKALKLMEDNGVAEKREVVHSGNGKTVIKYFAKG